MEVIKRNQKAWQNTNSVKHISNWNLLVISNNMLKAVAQLHKWELHKTFTCQGGGRKFSPTGR